MKRNIGFDESLVVAIITGCFMGYYLGTGFGILAGFTVLFSLHFGLPLAFVVFIFWGSLFSYLGSVNVVWSSFVGVLSAVLFCISTGFWNYKELIAKENARDDYYDDF